MRPTATGATIALAASAALLLGCASIPPDAPLTRVSPDYVGAGDTRGIRPMVYGARTVLQFDSLPAFIRVIDESGVEVPYERVGKYVRVSRRLNAFSVRFNLSQARFELATPRPPELARTVQAPAAPTAAVVPVSTPPAAPVPLTATREPHEADALLALASKQLDELRKAGGPANEAEAKALSAKLDRIEALVVEAATIVVRVHFEFASSELVVSPDLERVMIPAARTAERINVRGRTDALVAGAGDTKVALARALAARQYLVERGVSPDRIKVFSLPAGDRVAPSNSAQGRALNRRVDIELVNRQFAQLRRDAVALAADRGAS